MKIIMFAMIFLFFSCDGQESEKAVSTIKEENKMKTNILSYSDWYHSVVAAVKSQKLIEGYERDNVSQIIDNLSVEEYTSLQRHSKEFRGHKNFKEIFVLHYFEGEIVKSKLYYLFISDGKARKVGLEINTINAVLEEPTPISSLTFREISVLSISSENEYQDIVVISTVEDTNVLSKVGNPNEALQNFLE